MKRYPLDPFFAATGWTLTDVVAVCPCNGPEYRLRREHGVTELIADRLAVAAGLVPSLVWPEIHDEAYIECGSSDCQERFIPRDRQHRYCSARCRQREKARRYRATPSGAAKNREYRRRWYQECRDYDIAQSARRRAKLREDRTAA